jgi:putative DNA primase/helicase
MNIGTEERPHLSKEPIKVARDIIANHFKDDRGRLTLFEHRGTVWRWEGRWKACPRTWLLDVVMLALEDSVYRVETRAGEVGTTLLTEKGCSRERVARSVEAITRIDEEWAAPFWVRRPEGGEVTGVEHMVTFRDKVLNVKTGETRDLGPDWFDSVTINAKYDPTAECPLWMQSLEEWSGGDEHWIALMQKLFGYAIMPTRKYQKWFLFYGVPRSGKGTVLHMLRDLLGKGAVLNKGLSDLVSPFGLDGLEVARVLVVNEVHQLDTGDGSKAAAIVKQLVGQDPINVNIKFVRPLRNIESRALPILQSNEIPNLEDRAGGLSSKMVLLPFGVSFLNKENLDLAEQLRKELPGIAQWALKGSRALLEPAEIGVNRFPLLDSARDAVDDYIESVNPYNRFLDDFFEQDDNGWVASSVVWDKWLQWRRGRRIHAAPTQFTITRKMMEGTNWRLVRHRMGAEQTRGLKGLKLKYVPQRAHEGE